MIEEMDEHTARMQADADFAREQRELDALRKDAARYRWLRTGKREGVIAPYTTWQCGCRSEELDAAIDVWIELDAKPANVIITHAQRAHARNEETDGG